MKNGEGVALTVELDRKLKQSTDRLRDMRETLEELSRSADALHHLFGLQQVQEQTQAAPQHRLGEKAAKARTQKEQTATTPAASRPAPVSAPSASTPEEEIPEWRKVFPKLSAHVPGRGK